MKFVIGLLLLMLGSGCGRVAENERDSSLSKANIKKNIDMISHDSFILSNGAHIKTVVCGVITEKPLKFLCDIVTPYETKYNNVNCPFDYKKEKYMCKIPNTTDVPTPDVPPTAQSSSKSNGIYALLDVIAYAEDTDRNLTDGRTGYNKYYGSQEHFTNSSAHPGIISKSKYGTVNKFGKVITSTAAGRYQFLLKTWKNLWKGIPSGNPAMTEANQDVAAIALMKEKGVNPAIVLKDIGSFGNVVSKLNPVWASLPGSPHGQPIVDINTLYDWYRQSL